MDFELFFMGLGLIFIGFLMYLYIRGQRPSSEKTGWEGPTITAYVQFWGGLILCIFLGIVFILKSLPTHI
ncbi:hypothetical protein [Pedobacter nutrimenti]|uniref:Immunity protein 17 of polymorphic toxin system n=1 Tax=Pedobacter nutrimenti TaxID=1241337 RepID=A0A318UE28_9SPHI|nr:hypothetical protein [Pedobacter nutrimenti]PYF74343.1 hypothetical protein B0O44_104514 [Pedobacter nutrimenti]